MVLIWMVRMHANSFEDPITHEVGVDHELFRVLGCTESHRAILTEGSAIWRFMWMAMKDIVPAWTFTISGEDLDQDGPVTVTFGRAMEATTYNRDGSARAHMTFRADPDPRVNNNVYPGKIEDGVISLDQPGNYEYYNLSDALFFPTFVLRDLNVRLEVNPDGSLEGLIGGYQPIEHIYFALANGNLASEGAWVHDLPGIYHLLRRHADAGPDPLTGENWDISATYYLKAVPAYVMPIEDTNQQSASRR